MFYNSIYHDGQEAMPAESDEYDLRACEMVNTLKEDGTAKAKYDAELEAARESILARFESEQIDPSEAIHLRMAIGAIDAAQAVLEQVCESLSI